MAKQIDYEKVLELVKNPSDEVKATLKKLYEEAFGPRLNFPSGGYCPTPEFCKLMKTALKLRTGLIWRVTNARGTAYGWIRISAPSNRATDGDSDLSEMDQAVLSEIFNKERIHYQGHSLPSGGDYHQEAAQEVCCVTVTVRGSQYWD